MPRQPDVEPDQISQLLNKTPEEDEDSHEFDIPQAVQPIAETTAMSNFDTSPESSAQDELSLASSRSKSRANTDVRKFAEEEADLRRFMTDLLRKQQVIGPARRNVRSGANHYGQRNWL